MSGDLNPKQAAFVREYLVDLNGKQAAIRVGYAERSAEVQASRLLSNDKVAQAVQAAMDKRAERTEITADYVLYGIRDIVERCKATGEEFNPTAALRGKELLGKHLKLFTDKVEHSASDDLAAMLTAARGNIAQ